MTKRILDVIFALALSVFAAPLIAISAIAIRLESAGPALFKQLRVGRNGQPFVCYKLRTMYIDTPQAASHEIEASAITRVGAFLRRTKLDELPQLWNVFWGEMSVVGPRPCLPTQTELIERRKALGVLRLKPGITGLAQVNHIDMSDPARLAQIDAQYLLSATALGDIQLILLTLFAMLLTLFGKRKGDRFRV